MTNLTILHKDGKRYREDEIPSLIGEEPFSVPAIRCTNGEWDIWWVQPDDEGRLKSRNFPLPPSEYTIVPEVKVREIEWVEDKDTAALQSWDGFIDTDIISTVFMCKHSGEEYGEGELVVPVNAEGKYVRATFEPRQIAEDFRTIHEAMDWAQSQLNEFVKSMIEVK